MKIKAYIETEVPDPVGERLIKMHEGVDEVKFSMPLHFIATDTDGMPAGDYTYHLEAPLVWEVVDA
jgi:hypothetical protein